MVGQSSAHLQEVFFEHETIANSMIRSMPISLSTCPCPCSIRFNPNQVGTYFERHYLPGCWPAPQHHHLNGRWAFPAQLLQDSLALICFDSPRISQLWCLPISCAQSLTISKRPVFAEATPTTPEEIAANLRRNDCGAEPHSLCSWHMWSPDSVLY